MDSFKNIGISFTGDYIKQGSNLDKCEKSEKLAAKYIELFIRKDGKENDMSSLVKAYHGKIYFHLPTLQNDLSNLKQVTDYVINLVKYRIDTAIIDVSVLSLDVYDWSTFEEQQDYIRRLSNGFAQIISNGVNLLLENTADDGNSSYYGKRVEHLSDLLMYTKNILQKEYDFTKEKAESSIGVSFNISKLYGEINEYTKWINVLGSNIKVIKVTDVDNAISIFDGILSKISEKELDSVILLQIDKDIEEVKNKYRKFEYLINCKKNNKPLGLELYTDIKADSSEYDFSTTNQSGYSSVVIISMIVITILIAVIMLYFKFRS